MKTVSIQTKVLTLIGVSLALVGGFSMGFQTIRQTATVKDLDKAHSEGMGQVLSQYIGEVMINGDNDKLQPMAEELKRQGALGDLTIVDNEGNVARSTMKELTGSRTSDPLFARMLESGRDTLVEVEEKSEVVQRSYTMFHAKTACLECHDATVGAVLGGMRIDQPKTKLYAEITQARNWAAVVGLIAVAFLIGIVFWLLRRLVFVPLAEARHALYMAADGQVNQHINIKCEDEIGRTLKAIQRLIDYMKGLAMAAEKVAAGNLDVTVQPKDDQDLLGTAFKAMIASLRHTVGQVTKGSEALDDVSKSLAGEAKTASRSISDQNVQVSQIATAVEEMSATIIESSKNTSDASAAARDAADKAVDGGMLAGEVMERMNQIVHAVNNSSNVVRELAHSAEEIGAIVNVIDDIADQTNLLALNAAIEAARAGEQGRGFAVVADEVRKLAERTVTATGQITAMIKTVQDGTTAAVSEMESGVKEVEAGKELADRAGKSLEEIMMLSKRVTDMIQQIATASEEQSVAAESISKNAGEISEAIRGSAEGAERSASYATDLEQQARSLHDTVGKFNMTE